MFQGFSARWQCLKMRPVFVGPVCPKNSSSQAYTMLTFVGELAFRQYACQKSRWTHQHVSMVQASQKENGYPKER